MSEIDSSRIFTRQQVDDLLTAAINKTLLQVDNAKLFAHHEGRDKVKGIAGDIIEESVLGCNSHNKEIPVPSTKELSEFIQGIPVVAYIIGDTDSSMQLVIFHPTSNT